ncbi:MAG TPA: hypothetical protein VNY52_09740 [Solirubrobacteraceae bacterium]|jgi:hypothetical protein|nr:hypothetical protein [Solirubrobacteraceae bacterium]
MLDISPRTRLTLACALVSLLACSGVALTPPALAGTPATVTVRVLGANYEALTTPTQVTTTSAPVARYGGSCSGTSAAGALELGTKGNWEGTWSSKYSDYEVISIDGKSFPFEENAPANYYWSFWRNNAFEEVGVCEAQLESGDQILFVPACFGSSCPAPPTQVLGIEAPATAEVGRPITVTVRFHPTAGGESHPAAGVNVGGAGSSAETDLEGHATLTFPGDGTYVLRASGGIGEDPKPIPGEVVVCAHEGNDGTCGTPAPPGISPLQTSSSSSVTLTPPYTGPYALVAAATGIQDGHVYSRQGAPRVLSGTVGAHASVTSISLRLRRTHRGRCWAYDGARERLQRVRCRQGSFFQIASGGDSFSYLLPSRLPPGRYVLDIAATDAAGNRAPLDRGSSRIVFYVK